MKVHIWEISGFIKLNTDYAKKLEGYILNNFHSFRNFGIKNKLDRRMAARLCQREGKGFVKVSNFLKVIDSLDVSRHKAEKQIKLFKDSKTGAYGRVYQINFPFEITPPVIRLISHLIGDGSVYSDEMKYSQQDVTFIKKLAEEIVNPLNDLRKVKCHRNGKLDEYQFSIPMVVAKCVSEYLNINRNELGSPKFIEKCLSLSKKFRVQVLAAILLDDGCVQSGSIRMCDKNKIVAIRDLIDSLNYKGGEIHYKSHLRNYKGNSWTVDVYAVNLHAEGLRNFLRDLNDYVKMFGPLLDLWDKQKDLERCIRQHNFELIEKRKESKILRGELLNIFKRRDRLKLGNIAKEFDVAVWRIEYIIRDLMKKGKIVREDIGVYSETD